MFEKIKNILNLEENLIFNMCLEEIKQFNTGEENTNFINALVNFLNSGNAEEEFFVDEDYHGDFPIPHENDVSGFNKKCAVRFPDGQVRMSMGRDQKSLDKLSALLNYLKLNNVLIENIKEDKKISCNYFIFTKEFVKYFKNNFSKNNDFQKNSIIISIKLAAISLIISIFSIIVAILAII